MDIHSKQNINTATELFQVEEPEDGDDFWKWVEDLEGLGGNKMAVGILEKELMGELRCMSSVYQNEQNACL